ncbi:DVU_1556 family methyltransferase [Humidesulfovibrio sp.]
MRPLAPCPAPPLFARPEFQAVSGEALRPGGLALTRRALALLGQALPPGSTVLDLGCGRGATARLLAQEGFEVLGLDPSEDLMGAEPWPGVQRLRALAQALPLVARGLDAIFCECVLSVTGQSGAVLAEATRALKPGGWLALSDLYLRGASGHAAGGGSCLSCLSGAMPEATLRRHLEAAGFHVTHFEDHTRLLAELAGRLIFAGVEPGALCAGGRPGYFLCLARRG